MTEPTYEYKKGQGWVPTTKPQRWAVMYRQPGLRQWVNAIRRGVYYDDYNAAIQRMKEGQSRNPDCIYDVWPAEREAVEGRDAW